MRAAAFSARSACPELALPARRKIGKRWRRAYRRRASSVSPARTWRFAASGDALARSGPSVRRLAENESDMEQAVPATDDPPLSAGRAFSLQTERWAGEPVAQQEIAAELDYAPLAAEDCLAGRSALQAIRDFRAALFDFSAIGAELADAANVAPPTACCI